MSSVEQGERGGHEDRRLATTVAMVLATIAVTVGDLLMSQAMRYVGPLQIPSLLVWWQGGEVTGFPLMKAVLLDIYALLWMIFGSAQVWLAVGCMLVFLILWTISLSWSDLTFVMPLTALTYVLNAVLVGPVLGEEVTPLRWLGTLLIALGVGLVTLEKPSPTENN